jgi:ATP-dependent DNA helicase RecQ
MKDPAVFAQGFDRPNLFLEVLSVSGDEEKRQTCTQLATQGGSGIIYCATRKAAEGMHASLHERGVNAVLYHAGMEDEARRIAQEEFMAAREAVVVATNAFGMGIDKPDIRFVAHANIPRAVEAYYQEVGRAGRDGQPATALLLFNHADVYTQERLIESNHPSEVVLADIWNVVRNVPEFSKGMGVLAGMVGASEFEVSAALRIFERERKIERGGRGEGEHGITLTEKATATQPHAEESRRLLQSLLEVFPVGRAASVELPVLARRTGLELEEVRHALGLLEKAGAVKVRRPFAGRTIRALEQVPFRELGVDLSRVREQERRSLLMLKRMTDYAYTRRCRRGFILGYFGQQDAPQSCGSCDVCAGARMQRVAPAARPAASNGKPEGYSELAATELRRWRKALAKDLEIPPFIIFNDATLLGLAAALPTDRDTFLAVKGTGESRWERFGPKVVEICLMARAAGHEPVAVAEVPRARRGRKA